MTRLAARKWLGCFSLLAASCRSPDADERDVSPLPIREEKPQIQNGLWRPCQTATDCATGEVCTAVDTRPEPALLLAPMLEPKACATVLPPGATLEAVPDFERRYLDRLVAFKKVRFALYDPMCTLVGCHYMDGTPVECCNTCQDGVYLSGFRGVAILEPDGREVTCQERRDCDPPNCPRWMKLDKDFELLGAFRRGRWLNQERLEFVFAIDPQRLE